MTPRFWEGVGTGSRGVFLVGVGEMIGLSVFGVGGSILSTFAVNSVCEALSLLSSLLLLIPFWLVGLVVVLVAAPFLIFCRFLVFVLAL